MDMLVKVYYVLLTLAEDVSTVSPTNRWGTIDVVLGFHHLSSKVESRKDLVHGHPIQRRGLHCSDS